MKMVSRPGIALQSPSFLDGSFRASPSLEIASGDFHPRKCSSRIFEGRSVASIPGVSGCAKAHPEPVETVGRTLVIVVKVPVVRCAPCLRKKRQKNARTRGRERWLRWKTMLDEGVYESRSALARGVGVSPAAVTQGLQKLESLHSPSAPSEDQ